MTKFTITCPLVGDHARQGAKTILAHLPSGTALHLDPEPDNPYDSQAVKVSICPTQDIPEGQLSALAEELPASGLELEWVMGQEEFQLGYIAASGGKPLQRERDATGLDLQGNSKALEAMSDPGYTARLGFGPAGKPIVHIGYGEEEQ